MPVLRPTPAPWPATPASGPAALFSRVCWGPRCLDRRGLQSPPPQQCPTPSSVALDTEPCPRGRGAQPKRPHRFPGPGGCRPVCARSPPPRCCASSSRAPVPAHLLPVGRAPGPARPGPPRPPSLPAPLPSRRPRRGVALLARAEVRLAPPPLAARRPGPARYLGAPLPVPALLWGLRRCPPPTPRRARSGLAPRASRATLERHDRRAPLARPRWSRCTAHQAAGPAEEGGVGATSPPRG